MEYIPKPLLQRLLLTFLDLIRLLYYLTISATTLAFPSVVILVI